MSKAEAFAILFICTCALFWAVGEAATKEEVEAHAIADWHLEILQQWRCGQ